MAEHSAANLPRKSQNLRKDYKLLYSTLYQDNSTPIIPTPLTRQGRVVADLPNLLRRI